MTEKERLRALLGNIKNWDWTVYPQFKMEKEDAEALRQYFIEHEPALAGIFNIKE